MIALDLIHIVHGQQICVIVVGGLLDWDVSDDHYDFGTASAHACKFRKGYNQRFSLQCAFLACSGIY